MSTEDPSTPPGAKAIGVPSGTSHPNGRWLGASLFWRIFLLQAFVAIPVAILWPASDGYIRLKPSAIYFIMVLVLVIAALVSKTGLLFRLWGDRLGLAAFFWRRFNWLLVAYYIAMAIGNMILVFTASVEAWLQFKLYIPLIALLALCLFAPRFIRSVT